MSSSSAPVRAGTSADAIDGQVPAEVTRPESVEQVADVVCAAARAGLSVLPHGSRSKTGWAAPAKSIDLALDLTGLDQIVDHAAGDLVVVAQAGVRLSELSAHVAKADQMLALDPTEPDATLGGIVSANASGPRRLRFGTARDLLIGITAVLPDGSVASAGGRVVKNVAGYDLGKLFIGAHGSLGAVCSTTWRLHPLPSARAVVTLRLRDCSEATSLARTIAHSPLTPTAVELHGRAGSTGELHVVFESMPESVAAQAEAAVALLGHGELSSSLPTGFGQRPASDDAVSVRIAHPPKALPAVLSALPEGTEVRASARTGIVEAAIAAHSVADVAQIDRLREQLPPHQAHAVVYATPPALRGALDHWGPIGQALALMRRVKDEFDPEHRFSAGRFVGGI